MAPVLKPRRRRRHRARATLPAYCIALNCRWHLFLLQLWCFFVLVSRPSAASAGPINGDEAARVALPNGFGSECACSTQGGDVAPPCKLKMEASTVAMLHDGMASSGAIQGDDASRHAAYLLREDDDTGGVHCTGCDDSCSTNGKARLTTLRWGGNALYSALLTSLHNATMPPSYESGRDHSLSEGRGNLRIAIPDSIDTWSNVFNIVILPIQANTLLYAVIVLEQERTLPARMSQFSLEADSELNARTAAELPLTFSVAKREGVSLALEQSCAYIGLHQKGFSSAFVQKELQLSGADTFEVGFTACIPAFNFYTRRRPEFRSIHLMVYVTAVGVGSLILLVLLHILPVLLWGRIAGYRSETEASELPFHAQRSEIKHQKPEELTVQKCPLDHRSIVVVPLQMDKQGDMDLEKKLASDALPVEDDPIEGARTAKVSSNRKSREKDKRRRRKVANFGAQVVGAIPCQPLSPTLSQQEMSSSSWDPSSNHIEGTSDEQKVQHGPESGSGSEAESTPSSFSSKNSESDCTSVLSVWQSRDEQITPESHLLVSPEPQCFPASLSTTYPSMFRDDRSGCSTSVSLVSSSQITPHARAPGSHLIKDKTRNGRGSDTSKKELTYDIWGDYFSGHLLRWAREVPSMAHDEGDSKSFFAREPQSLSVPPSSLPVAPLQGVSSQF